MFSFGGSRLANEVFGGFVLNSIYQFQTGPPVEFSADIRCSPERRFAALPISDATPLLSLAPDRQEHRRLA